MLLRYEAYLKISNVTKTSERLALYTILQDIHIVAESDIEESKSKIYYGAHSKGARWTKQKVQKQKAQRITKQ